MISAAKTSNPRHRRAGFTLIEIVMVLGIAAIVMGGAVGMMIYSSDERVLRDASGEIEMLAKRARTTSILQQTPYALEFREGIVRLMPLAQAGRDEKKTALGNNVGGTEVDSEGGERWEFA
nr:prepilin-type N-terminal cleavage/methylation domain-containing protein [Akkermansiaceae bacterium]